MGRVRLIFELSIAILTSALAANPARKFIAVEMAYFYKWWQIADVGQKITTQRV